MAKFTGQDVDKIALERLKRRTATGVIARIREAAQRRRLPKSPKLGV